jgi:hypothetical protein
MATKPKKVTRKKSTGRVRDLATRKDPKGGAQKKEGPRSDAPIKPGKTRLS